MNWFVCTLVVFAMSFLTLTGAAATLIGGFSPVVAGSNINLTLEGKVDWVHWGLANETSLNRKATVIPQISDFEVLYQVYTVAYQQIDNPSRFLWSDGSQVVAVTNTPAGVYVFSAANPRQQTNGFQFTVPASPELKTLKVYVGTFGAQGRFEASLSDHPTSYSNTTLNNALGGPGGVYTINFAANSSNQTLTIRWTVFAKNDKDANVTLQAATLSTPNANSPPFARITSPLMNSVFAGPTNITISADAFDPDDSISRVQFLKNGIVVGESTNSPYSLTISNVPPGRSEFTAIPFDQTNATSTSCPIEIFVHSTGGLLTGAVAVPPFAVDLTAEGTLDWVHWGLLTPTDVNRKLGVPLRINMATLGTNPLQHYADNYTGYGWKDGVPTTNVSDTKTGVFLPGINRGFQLSVPADTVPKTLKIYVGLYGGSGNFQAWLSDFSAPAFTDRSLTNSYGNSYAVCTLDYTAASNGQTLNVKYTADALFDQDYGNVTLQAAALSGSALIAILNPRQSSNHFLFSLETDLGRTYNIFCTDSLESTNWQFLTNVIGSGVKQTVSDSVVNPHRFYRIQTN